MLVQVVFVLLSDNVLDNIDPQLCSVDVIVAVAFALAAAVVVVDGTGKMKVVLLNRVAVGAIPCTFLSRFRGPKI